MATLVVSSDDKTNFDGQGYLGGGGNPGDTVYATVHDAALATLVTNYNQWHPVGQRYNLSALGRYQIFRAVMRFDLSSLPVGATIISAVMTVLRSSSWPTQYRDWNMVLVDGSDCEDPIVAADYGELLDDTTSLGSIAISVTSVSTAFEITLNAAGRAFLESKAGSVAVIAARSSEDINSTAPPDYNATEYTEITFSLIDTTDFPYITITYGEAPQVSTDPATGVGMVLADINGTLDDDGAEACDCGFEWGETVAYGNTTPTQSRTTGQTFSQAISGLDPATTYHFRTFATNSQGTSYGSDQSFTTPVGLPTLTTEAASAIGLNGATLNGALTSDGGEPCYCGFEWGATIAYGSTTPTQRKVTGEVFSQPILNLGEAAQYHFRAFATNSSGTAYGEDRTIDTLFRTNRAYALARYEI